MTARKFITLLLFCAVAGAQVLPEVTEDGLVRAPSSRKVGVYRAPDVPFSRYRSIILGSIPVTFRKGWERSHRELEPEDLEKIRAEFVVAFRKELRDELVTRGDYTLLDEP